MGDFRKKRELPTLNGRVGTYKIIRFLNVNKAHGHDGILVRMIKMCDESLVQPLSLIFKGCIDTGVYPDTWKKFNIVPVHKKGDKQIVNITDQSPFHQYAVNSRKNNFLFNNEIS